MTWYCWPARGTRIIRRSRASVCRSPSSSRPSRLCLPGRWLMLEALRLSALIAPLSAELVGDDVAFSAVSIDSRAIAPGQLFVALAGPRFDGHDYLAEVAGKGAVAALVEREVANAPLAQLLVSDSRLALGQLGALNRQAFKAPVVAITGSSGKTT